MMGIDNKQIDMFDYMIFERLIPPNHLLVKINSIIDFTFVYDIVRDFYSSIGRASKDPVLMFKIELLEYLYDLSDVKLKERAQTDIAFRWFLGLGIDDSVPDDTTISHFRCNRLNETVFEEFFNEIVKKCISFDLVKQNRFIIDSTNVDANVNFPKRKKLIEQSFVKVVALISKFDKSLSEKCMEAFRVEINKLYKTNEKVRSKAYAKVTLEQLNYIYIKSYDELQYNTAYIEAYNICFTLVNKTVEGKKSEIISVVDTDARVAHKTKGVLKRGYKDHIIIDEDSEIILAVQVTPFNVGDEKELEPLLNKVIKEFNIKPSEVSADTVYGTTSNRAYLLDKEIVSSIRFPKKSSKENKNYGINDFVYSKDLKFATCKNNIQSNASNSVLKDNKNHLHFKFNWSDCDNCSQRLQCLKTNKSGKIIEKSKAVFILERYDAVLKDKKRNSEDTFKISQNKRYKVERRFATMVRNNGLRRTRYLRLSRTKIHITMSNLACNVVRMVNIICGPGFSAAKIWFK